MTDPKRIIHGPEGTLETALLRSVRREAPPAQAKGRMFALLGISTGSAGAAALATVSAKAAVTAATASTKATSAAALALTGKWVVVSIVGAALAVGVAREMSPSGNATSRAPVASHVSGQASPRATQLAIATAHASAKSAEPSELATEVLSAESGVSKRAIRSFPDSTAPEKPRDPSNLADEVAVLDKARTAAVAGDPARTLRLLDSYQRQYPNGNLGPEAQLLRIEALVQNGQSSVALPIARRMLKDAPSGPHAERIRGILPAADSTDGESKFRSNSAASATSQ